MRKNSDEKLIAMDFEPSDIEKYVSSLEKQVEFISQGQMNILAWSRCKIAKTAVNRAGLSVGPKLRLIHRLDILERRLNGFDCLSSRPHH